MQFRLAISYFILDFHYERPDCMWPGSDSDFRATDRLSCRDLAVAIARTIMFGDYIQPSIQSIKLRDTLSRSGLTIWIAPPSIGRDSNRATWNSRSTSWRSQRNICSPQRKLWVRVATSEPEPQRGDMNLFATLHACAIMSLASRACFQFTT
jgi:hypothetical protein